MKRRKTKRKAKKKRGKFKRKGISIKARKSMKGPPNHPFKHGWEGCMNHFRPKYGTLRAKKICGAIKYSKKYGGKR